MTEILKRLKPFLIVCIVLGLFFLRLWKIPNLFYFGIDEEYHAYLAESIVKHFHLLWIGANAGNTGFYLGPGFIYLNAFLFWISNNDPIILAYFSFLLGITTILILYLVTKEIFSKKIALITIILYGFSTFVVFYDRRFWNPMFIPLMVILLYFSFIKSLKNQNWLILSFFLTALSFHIHLSLIIFFPLIFIQLFILIKSKRISIRTIILSIFVYTITISPLIVYDFVHNFDNLKTPLRIINGFKDSAVHLSLLTKARDITIIIGQFFLKKDTNLPLSFVLGLLSLVTIIYVYLKKKNLAIRILILFVAVYIISSLFYPGTYNDYYLLGFLPFLAILVSVFLEKFNPVIYSIILGLFIILNLKTFLALAPSYEVKDLLFKKRIVTNVCHYLNKGTYSFFTDDSYMNYGGWGYLFKIYCYPPLQSQADEVFAWMYPKEISTRKAKYKLILTDLKKPIINFPRKGIIKTYIYNPYRVDIILN